MIHVRENLHDSNSVCEYTVLRYMFVLISVYRGLVLTRNQYSGTVTGGSPTMSRRDSTSPRALRRPIHPGGGSM